MFDIGLTYCYLEHLILSGFAVFFLNPLLMVRHMDVIDPQVN